MTELKGRAVIDPTTARRRGVVEDVLVDASAARVAAIDIKHSESEPPARIAAHSIARIGRDAVMLTRGTEEPHTPPTAVECLDYSSLVGLEVLEDGGDRVGYLQDARIDPDSLAVTAYELAGAGWRRWLGGRADIGANEVTSWSRELMLVRSGRSTRQDSAEVGIAGDVVDQAPTPTSD